jgi:hypothetical protein
MTGFNLDFNDTFDGGKIKDGYYEVIINRASEGATPGGAEYAEFDLIVRNDIDQPYKNKHIFHKVWKSKQTHKYNMKMFNTIGKAAKLQSGKTYKSFDDLLNDFVHKTALIFVKVEESEYNGKTYENENVKSWAETKYPDVQHQFKNDDNSNANDQSMQTADIQDDDLPF